MHILLVSVNTGRPTVLCFAKSTQLWSNHSSVSICHQKYEDAQMCVLPLLLENCEVLTQNGNCRRPSDIQGDNPIFQVLYALNMFTKYFMKFWGKACSICGAWPTPFHNHFKLIYSTTSYKESYQKYSICMMFCVMLLLYRKNKRLGKITGFW